MIGVLMISGDRNLLDASSQVSKRTERLTQFASPLVVVLAGTGDRKELVRGSVRIIFPGGKSRFQNARALVTASRQLVRTEGFAVITAQDPFFLGLVGVLASLVKRTPLQIQVHTDFLSSAYAFRSVRGLVELAVAALVLPFATRVRVVTEHIARGVTHYTTAVIDVLPVAVDTEPFAAIHPVPHEYTDQPRIVLVSRLAPEKRIDTVLRALTRVPPPHLYIVGDGPLRSELEHLAKELSLNDRVHFLGWKDSVAAYYQHADCFVQASAFEGYGVSLVEALIAGIPVVTTDVGIVSDLPVDAVTVHDGSEYGLARALSTTLDSINETRQRQTAARASFLETVPDQDTYTARYQSILESCVSS